MADDFGFFRAEVDEERAIEADEINLLSQAETFLITALKKLAVTKEESSKERTATMKLYQSLAYNITGRLAQASVEVANAITMLRNSIADEEKFRQIAEDAGRKAGRRGASALTIVEANAMNKAAEHEKTIKAMITSLEAVKESLEAVRNISQDSLGNSYYNLDGLRKRSTVEIQLVIDKISIYAKGLNNLSKILERAEGKKPWWKFW